MSTPNTPVALKELDIPGRTGPVSNNPIIWGINIAAALGNFPLHGLLCRAGPWGNMAIGDTLRISWGSGQNVWVETVDKTEVNTQLQMFVPFKHMVDGRFAVSYVVKPLGGTDQPSDVMQVLVKLTRPGGDSPLIMIIPQAILDGGIDKDNVADGVPITIGIADGTPPYSNAAAGDVCRVSWGGIYVFSDPLTQEQAEGKAPIIITIIEAVIREAGDADFPGVAVVFEVYDIVFNRSEDWSAEQRVVVAVDATRLVAPLLKETQNNVLDVDKLGDANGTVQVIATDTSKFKVGDEVFIRIKGTPVEGPPIDWEPSAGVKLESLPSVVETTAPNAVLRQLAKSQITLSYRLEKADGSADLRSKSQFIRAIGEVQRLAAPKVLDENSGALDPALDKIRLEIPFDKSFAEGQALKIFMLGTTPGLEPYLPDLALRPITHNDIVAAQPLLYNIDGKHLAPVNGGTAEFYYQQLIADAVLATLNPFEATRAVRESIHTDILRVGEPRLELPEPEVAGVVNGVLPADTAGTTATVTYTKTVSGDEVFMFWLGWLTGEYPDSIKLNEFTAGQRVPFPIPAAVIKGNEGGTVEARYHIVRAAGGTSYSDTLTFSVGVALENPLPLPQMPQTTGTGASVTLAPLDAQTGARVVVTFTGMNETQSIKLFMTGTPGAGSPDIPAKPGVISGGVEFLIPAEAIAANIGNTAQIFTLEYEVTAGTGEIPSETLTVTVTPLPAAELDKLSIVEAEGDELDLSKVTAGATFRAGVWAFMKSGQPVWAELKGKTAQGAAHDRAIWIVPGSSVNQTWINAGKFDRAVPFSYLKVLGHDTYLEIVFKVALTLSQVEEEAIAGPVKRYRVKAVEDVIPTITSVIGSPSGDEIPPGEMTVDTDVTLRGVAAKSQRVEIFDGAVSQGTPDVDPLTGLWTLFMPKLSKTQHVFLATALYGTGQSSDAYTINVVALRPPVLLDPAVSPIDVLTYEQGVNLRVAFAEALPAQQAQLKERDPLPGSEPFPLVALDPGKQADFSLASEFLVARRGTSRRFYWTLTSGGRQVGDSPDLTLVINVITENDPRLPMPTIAGETGQQLKIQELPADAQALSAKIPLKKLSHPVWVDFEGVNADGKPDTKEIWVGDPNESEYGILVPAQVEWLKTLKHGSPLRVVCAVNLDGIKDKTKAVPLPVRAYTAETVEDVRPVITRINGSPSGNPITEGGSTVETTVTIRGTAAKGQKVQVFDGTTPQGQPTADQSTGVWEWVIRNLSVTTHSITAQALYGSNLISLISSFKVVSSLSIGTNRLLSLPNYIIAEGRRPATPPSDAVYSQTASGGVPPYVSYVSSNPSVATVSPPGVVTGISNGQTRITVTDSAGNSAFYTLTVSGIKQILRNDSTPRALQDAANYCAARGGRLATLNEMLAFYNLYARENPDVARLLGWPLIQTHPSALTGAWTSSNSSTAGWYYFVNLNGQTSLPGVIYGHHEDWRARPALCLIG